MIPSEEWLFSEFMCHHVTEEFWISPANGVRGDHKFKGIQADFKPASRDSDQAIPGEQHEITATNPPQLPGGAQY